MSAVTERRGYRWCGVLVLAGAAMLTACAPSDIETAGSSGQLGVSGGTLSIGCRLTVGPGELLRAHFS